MLLLIIIILSVILFTGRKDTVSSGAVSVPPGDLRSGDGLPDLADTIDRLFSETKGIGSDRETFVEDFWRWIFTEAGLPERLSRRVAASALDSPAFVMELLTLLLQDPYTYYLVDKRRALPADYEPDDLVPLNASSYRLSRER